MRNRTLIAIVPGLVALAILSQAAPAEARTYGRGYIPHHPPPLAYKWRVHAYLGAEAAGFVVLGQQLENVATIGHGGGVGLFGGVRLGRWVALEAAWRFTAHTEYMQNPDGAPVPVGAFQSHQLQTVTGAFKLIIPTHTRVEPFIQAGGGWAFFGITDSPAGYLEKTGPMFSVGGGLNAWLNPWFSLGGKVLYEGIYLGESDRTWTVRDSDGTERTDYQPGSNYISGLSIALFASFHI